MQPVSRCTCISMGGNIMLWLLSHHKRDVNICEDPMFIYLETIMLI